MFFEECGRGEVITCFIIDHLEVGDGDVVGLTVADSENEEQRIRTLVELNQQEGRELRRNLLAGDDN